MEKLEYYLRVVVDLLWGNWLMILFMFLGVHCSFNTKFIQIRKFPFIIKSFYVGLINSIDNKSSNKEVNEIHGILLALASCVGSGNIVGVSTAVLLGGAGALFWMWVAAFLGMATKFSEIVLGLIYREKNEKGEYVGGPMYYISKGLNAKWLGSFVAIFLFIQNTSGVFIQSNTISNSINTATGINVYVVGVVIAILVLIVISGGLRRLVKTVEKIVPIMALIYIFFGILIIVINYKKLPEVFNLIYTQAFNLKAGAGASMGIAMRYGIARGIYSNEAGEGSAAVIHSTVTNTIPSKQGLYGIVEVFIDTIIICTITGLVILTSGVSVEQGSSITVVSDAFGSVFSPLQYIVVLSLVLFCFTSILSQWYFGYVSLNFFKLNKMKIKAYQVFFPIAIVIGSIFSSDIVWLIQDLVLVLLIIPNIIALIILSPKIKESLKKYDDLHR